MLVGARLNWLLTHGVAAQWSPPVRVKFVQVDIGGTELDGNRPIAAPVGADIGLGDALFALRGAVRPHQTKPGWLERAGSKR